MVKFSKTKDKRITELKILMEGKQIVLDSLTKKKDMTLERLNSIVEASKAKSDKEIEKARSKLEKLKQEYDALLVLRENALTQDSDSKQNEQFPESPRDETYSVGSC